MEMLPDRIAAIESSPTHDGELGSPVFYDSQSCTVADLDFLTTTFRATFGCFHVDMVIRNQPVLLTVCRMLLHPLFRSKLTKHLLDDSKTIRKSDALRTSDAQSGFFVSRVYLFDKP